LPAAGRAAGWSSSELSRTHHHYKASFFLRRPQPSCVLLLVGAMREHAKEEFSTFNTPWPNSSLTKGAGPGAAGTAGAADGEGATSGKSARPDTGCSPPAGVHACLASTQQNVLASLAVSCVISLRLRANPVTRHTHPRWRCRQKAAPSFRRSTCFLVLSNSYLIKLVYFTQKRTLLALPTSLAEPRAAGQWSGAARLTG
jgi:hypothetical protein